jgi:hypothetical protein
MMITQKSLASSITVADLGEYLIAKGADDSIQNINGLTCWEGLDLDDI